MALIHASQVILLGVLQRHRNKNHRALSKISRRDVLFSNLERSAVGRDFAAALDPNVSSSLSLGSMRELVGANEGINLSKEGVNGGDDPAIFGLKDLSQVALDRRSGCCTTAGILLASLRGAVLQSSKHAVAISRKVLETINSIVVQSSAIDSAVQLSSLCRGSEASRDYVGVGVALDPAVQLNSSLGGLGNTHVVLQDVASGNSSGVAVDRLVHVERGPGTIAPVVTRTTEIVSCTLDGDAHLGAEGVAGLGNLLVGDEGARCSTACLHQSC